MIPPSPKQNRQVGTFPNLLWRHGLLRQRVRDRGGAWKCLLGDTASGIEST
jgi:hypothetical protein